ncbi:hypothetical protein [Fischerella thermalis]|nr:hypothetical protein [Fischerella thermalis]
MGNTTTLTRCDILCLVVRIHTTIQQRPWLAVLSVHEIGEVL